MNLISDNGLIVIFLSGMFCMFMAIVAIGVMFIGDELSRIKKFLKSRTLYETWLTSEEVRKDADKAAWKRIFNL
jgi:hypothetical protein